MVFIKAPQREDPGKLCGIWASDDPSVAMAQNQWHIQKLLGKSIVVVEFSNADISFLFEFAFMEISHF